MTIDEAIELVKIERECVIRADVCDRKCEKCDLLQDSTELTDMYEQLAEWLKELKEYRTLDNTNFSDGYNKAIDDFAEKLCCAFNENSTRTEYDGIICNMLTLDIASDLVVDVSEQLRKEN